MPAKNMKSASDKLKEAADRAEKEVREVIAYLDREVVPAVRQHSGRALRTASRKLEKLADSLERQRQR